MYTYKDIHIYTCMYIHLKARSRSPIINTTLRIVGFACSIGVVHSVQMLAFSIFDIGVVLDMFSLLFQISVSWSSVPSFFIAARRLIAPSRGMFIQLLRTLEKEKVRDSGRTDALYRCC